MALVKLIRKEDIKTITDTLYKRKSVSAKFKVSLYPCNEYYHKEYIYNIKSIKSATLNLDMNKCIEISVPTDKSQYMILTEMDRNKLIRKVGKLVALLERYIDGECDILDVTSIGSTNIAPWVNTVINPTIKLKILKNETTISLIYDEELGEGINITSDVFNTFVKCEEFVELMYILKSINYSHMALELVTYMQSSEIGNNTMDFRHEVLFPKDNETQSQPSISSVRGDFKGLNTISKPKPMSSKKAIQWTK